MATKEDESMDLFECAVCLRCMLDHVPRFLHCHHTFCEECIAQLKQDRKIACPTCRETTNMKSDDVKELSANFMLSKVKEAIKNIPKARAVSKCEVCRAKKATFLCATCLLPLCLPCKASHAASGLESHDVLQLCEKHQEGISHICMKCITPLCMTCMLQGHQEHKTDFAKYSEGVTKMQSELQVLLTEMQITLLKVDPFLQSVKKMATRTSTIKEKLCSHRAYYLEKLDEVNGLISSIEKNSFAYDDIKLHCMQCKDMCIRVSQDLNSSIKDKIEISKKYQGIKVQACNAIERLKSLVDRKLYMPQFLVEPLPSNVIVTPGKIDSTDVTTCLASQFSSKTSKNKNGKAAENRSLMFSGSSGAPKPTIPKKTEKSTLDFLEHFAEKETHDHKQEVHVGGLSFSGTPVLSTPEPQKPKPEMPKETEKPKASPFSNFKFSLTPSTDKTGQKESEKANKTFGGFHIGSPVPSAAKAAPSGDLQLPRPGYFSHQKTVVAPLHPRHPATTVTGMPVTKTPSPAVLPDRFSTLLVHKRVADFPPGVQSVINPGATSVPDQKPTATPLVNVLKIVTPSKLVGEDKDTVHVTSPGVHFESIIPLPDEEGYKVMFTARTKLYRFTEKQWKERGLGDIKILYSSEKQHARLIMRREQVYKVCLNHYIKKDMEIQFRSRTEQNILVWNAVDYSDETPAMYAFNAKFKNEDIASDFKKKFEEVQAILPTDTPENPKTPDGKIQEKANSVKSLFKQEDTSTTASGLLKNRTTGDNKTKVIVGGLSFSGTPVLSTPEPQKPKPEMPTETEKAKASPFSKFKFNFTPSTDKTAQKELEKANKTFVGFQFGSPAPSLAKAVPSGGLFGTSAVGSPVGFGALVAEGSSGSLFGKTAEQKDFTSAGRPLVGGAAKQDEEH